SLLNSDLALYSTRRRSFSARSVAQLAPGLSDYAHFCSTAAGVIGSAGAPVRRYVGFTRARVSERSTNVVEYKDYVEWVDAIAAQLQRHDGQGVTVFDRYALYAGHPDRPIPQHILFDIEDVEEEYLPRDGASNGAAQQMLLDDRCWDVIDGEFSCTT